MFEEEREKNRIKRMKFHCHSAFCSSLKMLLLIYFEGRKNTFLLFVPSHLVPHSYFMRRKEKLTYVDTTFKNSLYEK